MAEVKREKKSCVVNPLKMSQPVGAALAFLGLDACLPLLHGSQGCTAFGLVLFVRHFREAIPLQTTAMNETTAIMGGAENLEKAIMNICQRAQPAIIGICSTGLTETQGDDVEGHLAWIRARHPELAGFPLVYVPTPDYKGAFEDGWGRAVTKIIEQLAEPTTERHVHRINVLPGSHLTPGDIEELREIIEAFGLEPIILPDISGSLDGHVPSEFSPTTLGGTTLEDIRACGASAFTIGVGEHMRAACEALKVKAAVPYAVLPRLTGLEPNDQLMTLLSEHSGRPVPAKYRRQRSQLMDAMLDAHFFFGGKKVAIGAEPDLLLTISAWLADMGAETAVAVTTTDSQALADVPAEGVLIGDLEDLESRAAGCDLLITHAHGRQMAQRLDLPFLRLGLPVFDRLGAASRVVVGYRGTRDLTFEIGNMFLSGTEGSAHPAVVPDACGVAAMTH